jgi:hypothetical protein
LRLLSPEVAIVTSCPHTPNMFVAENERRPHNTHVLLITTGSVASIKAPLIVQELLSVRLNPPVGLAANSRRPLLLCS